MAMGETELVTWELQCVGAALAMAGVGLMAR